MGNKLALCVGSACLYGALAFTGGMTLLPRRLTLVAGTQQSMRNRPPATASLRMQNENAPNPVDLLIKSQPASREGVDLFVGEDAATFDWANEQVRWVFTAPSSS